MEIFRSHFRELPVVTSELIHFRTSVNYPCPKFYLPKNGTESNQNVRDRSTPTRMGYTQRIDPSITRHDDSPGRGPTVFVQRQPLEPDRLPKVKIVLTFRRYGPLHPTPIQQDVDTCNYESMTKHVFGGQTDEDECDFGDMSRHK